MEEIKEEIKLFSSFGGSDMISVLNGKAVGEVEEVTYTESLVGAVSTGVIRCAVFDRSSIKEIMTGDDKFMILYANEYGDRMAMIFQNFRLLEKKGSHTVDDLILKEDYTFEFSSITTKKCRFTVDEKTHLYRLLDE